jgi:hypothetical protein
VRQDLPLFSVEKKVESCKENCLQRDQGWELIELYFRWPKKRAYSRKLRECIKITGRCRLFLQLFKDAVSTVAMLRGVPVPTA